MGQSRPFFVYFRPFLITISIIQIEKSIDVVLWIQTRGCKMEKQRWRAWDLNSGQQDVVADDTTELWWPP